jgi:hypothetical protein
MLALAVILLCVAVAGVAAGIARVDVRLVAGGCAVAGAIWLGCGWLSENDESSFRVVTLRLHVTGAATGEALPEVAVSARASEEGSEPVFYRLPSSIVGRSGLENGEILLVSIIAEVRLVGSLVDRLRDPPANAALVDQEIEFTADGYQPLRRSLSQLLPEGWPYAKMPQTPVEVMLEREPREGAEALGDRR